MIGDLVTLAWLVALGWGFRGWWEDRKAIPPSFGDQLLVDMLLSVDQERSRWKLGADWKITSKRKLNWGGRRLVVTLSEDKGTPTNVNP